MRNVGAEALRHLPDGLPVTSLDLAAIEGEFHGRRFGLYLAHRITPRAERGNCSRIERSEIRDRLSIRQRRSRVPLRSTRATAHCIPPRADRRAGKAKPPPRPYSITASPVSRAAQPILRSYFRYQLPSGFLSSSGKYFSTLSN